jgi:hypothetical protein
MNKRIEKNIKQKRDSQEMSLSQLIKEERIHEDGRIIKIIEPQQNL